MMIIDEGGQQEGPKTDQKAAGGVFGNTRLTPGEEDGLINE